uniref:class I SAM-dependent methyltransferase n=1 Tax=Trichocoleus desertorum TaxID=1481672 RepID=UPI0025B43C8C|nr:methyltransferase domain-containing protein [Trichocoleus desertorum]
MNLKSSLETWLPPGFITIAKLATGKTPEQKVKRYLQNGCIPWSPGYELYKENLIHRTLQDQTLIESFKSEKSLPQNYGIRLDERCVEYPWLFSRLPYEATHILDAGSSLNYEYILEQPYFENKHIHIVTLAPEPQCFWYKGVSYLFEDLRNLPLKSSFYDAIVCLSTLEHVGLDNTQYSEGDRYNETRSSDFKLAINELKRVLKPGGSLFISIPFGQYQNLGYFQQFDSRLLSETVEAFGSCQDIHKTFFRYTASGWRFSPEEECADCMYVKASEWMSSDATNASKTGKNRSGLAASAQAVACIHIVY